MISYYLKISKPKFGVNLNIYDIEAQSGRFPQHPRGTALMAAFWILKAFGHWLLHSWNRELLYRLSRDATVSKNECLDLTPREWKSPFFFFIFFYIDGFPWTFPWTSPAGCWAGWWGSGDSGGVRVSRDLSLNFLWWGGEKNLTWEHVNKPSRDILG